MAISLEHAERLIAAARDIATELGETVSLAIVDADRHLVAFARMDGAALDTEAAAERKASAAVVLGFDTVQANFGAPAGRSMFGGPHLSGPHALVPNGGGVLLRAEGKVVGALGVSGSLSSITDHKVGTLAVARAGT
ncbi:GlcG/HbpS family heme-binding protein [Nocardia goodfellowii]